MKSLKGIVGTLALLAVTGCVGVVTEGANITRDKILVSNNIDAAHAGNAEAQYKVGEAMCCSLDEGGEGFYNTPQSVAWLCMAAAQNYGPAAFKLGSIYSGDVVDGVRLLRRITQAVAGSSTEPAVAYAWLRRADALGEADADKSATAIWADLNADEQAEASAYVTGQKPLPCEWSEVNPTS